MRFQLNLKMIKVVVFKNVQLERKGMVIAVFVMKLANLVLISEI